jgi:hypothetical protein
MPAGTRFARKLQALARADAKRLGFKGKDARKARDELVRAGVAEITRQLAR